MCQAKNKDYKNKNLFIKIYIKSTNKLSKKLIKIKNFIKKTRKKDG